jgi:hypothetical protein
VQGKADLYHLVFVENSMFIGTNETAGNAEVENLPRHPSLGDLIVKRDVTVASVSPTSPLLAA